MWATQVAVLESGESHGNTLAGHSLRSTDADQESRVQRDRDPVAGARNWRQYDNLHSRQLDSSASVAGQRHFPPRRTGYHRRQNPGHPSQCDKARHVVSELPRLRQAEPGLFRAQWYRGPASVDVERGRRAETSLWANGDGELL